MEEPLDLFRTFTPEMLTYFKNSGRGVSEKLREYWAGKSNEERHQYCLDSFGSREARDKSYISRLETCNSEAYKLKVGETSRRIDRNRSAEERARVSKSISKGVKRYLSTLSKDEMDERMNNSFNSSESKEKWIRSYQSLSKEAKDNWVESRFRGWQEYNRVSMPEFFAGIYIEKNLPGEVEYTGNNDEAKIGNRKPDFTYKYKKKVISIFGSHWHNKELFPNKPSFEEEIAYYKRFGYDCIVIQEEDCYSEEALDKIFKEIR